MIKVYFDIECAAVTFFLNEEGLTRLKDLLASIDKPGEHFHLSTSFIPELSLEQGVEGSEFGTVVKEVHIGWNNE